MAGLWSGQAAQTPLGSFPELAMDFRAADAHWLFGRVDLDAQNSLRYGFAVEDLPDGPTLVYRNGGYFQGVLRDTTTVLMDCDEDAGVYHFCAQSNACLYVDGGCIQENGGCPFIDALFTFESPTQLVFNAHVNGQEHLIWTATREETRTLPAPFPQDATPVAASADWPSMPELAATVSWASPLANPTDVWVILSDMPCATGSCTPSRTLLTLAPAGSTTATLMFQQIHAGSYDANALVDLAGSFETTLLPSAGDLISVPPDQTIAVPSSGEGTASLAADYTYP
jgi:hypothetical protein